MYKIIIVHNQKEKITMHTEDGHAIKQFVCSDTKKNVFGYYLHLLVEF